MLADRMPGLPERPILKYYAYVATAWGGFHLPVDVLLFQSRGLTLEQVGLLTAVGSAVTILAEIPTGYVGDRIGRRNSLLVSSGLMTAGAVTFATVRSFPAFVFAQVTFIVGGTFRSGTTDAWLYDYLDAHGREDEFARLSGRARSALLVVLGVTSVAGGYLGNYDYGYAYLATAVVTGTSFLVVTTMSEPPRSGERDDRLTVSSVATSVWEDLGRPDVRPVVIGLGLFFGVATGLNAVFIQPVATSVGVSVDQLGWLFAALTGAGAVASYATGWIEERVETERWLVGVPLAVGITFAGIAVLPALAVPAFLLLRAVQRVTQSLAGQYLNDRVRSAGRATVLSVFGMVYSVFGIPVRIGGGRLAEAMPVTTAVAVVGSTLLVGSAYLGVRLSLGGSATGRTESVAE